MKGEIKYGNRNNEYRITNTNTKNILVTNKYERGNVEKLTNSTAKITFNKFYYRINDSFDFNKVPNPIGTYDSQPLGNWDWNVINVSEPSMGGGLQNIDFREYNKFIGKPINFNNYYIVTNYVQLPEINLSSIIVNTDTYKIITINYE